MGRSGKIIRGRFGKRRSRASGLPPELVSLLEVERNRRMWHRYWPLWSGAVAVGLAIGLGPGLWNRGTAPTPQTSTIAPQTLIQEQPSVDDREWSARSDDREWAVRSDESTDAPAATTAAASAAIFSFCHTGGGTNCVVDGDTIWMNGQKVRVADIDAPETHDYRCLEEKSLGDRATRRLIELVNSGPVTLRPVDRDEDVYGRKLRIVMVNGTSVGETLVAEGLARYYAGGRKPWC